MTPMPRDFLRVPLAHRGLHGSGRPENSLAAARAAIEAGYGIEIDVQAAAKGVPLVFHDYDLARMTGDEAYLADLDLDDLADQRLMGTEEAIPTLAQMLRLIDGRVPLLIEIKDQDGRLGPKIGDLHTHVADQLKSYDGPVAVMSFNPHVVRAFAEAAPAVPVGLVTCGFRADDWPALDGETRRRLADIDDFAQVGASFVAHDKDDLLNPRVDALKAQGVPILCWTIGSPAEEQLALTVADNITFEGYRPQPIAPR